MILFANILQGIGYIFNSILTLALILVIARAVLSWVNPDPNNPIVRFLRASTDPLLLPVQRMMPLSAGGIDFSPIILIFLIYFLQFAVGQSLMDYAMSIRQSALYGG